MTVQNKNQDGFPEHICDLISWATENVSLLNDQKTINLKYFHTERKLQCNILMIVFGYKIIMTSLCSLKSVVVVLITVWGCHTDSPSERSISSSRSPPERVHAPVSARPTKPSLQTEAVLGY